MKSKKWFNGLMSMVGLCIAMGALLTSGCAQSGEDAALAAPAGNNPGVPGDFSGVTQNWDKKLPSASRFTVLADFNNEAVRDNETGLVWDRSPGSGIGTWASARGICLSNPIVGNTSGWRLPSVHELLSLVDRSNSNPALPTGHPFTNVENGQYWTATVNAAVYPPTSAFTVSINTGTPLTQPMTDQHLIWCVRGGGPLSTY